MPYSLAIFDLDGTLVDSFPWFLRTINDVADRFGFRRVADGDVERLRHASTREILSRLEVPVWKLPAIARYARRLKGEAAAEISLFAGVEAMLQTLADNGVRLALVTSDSEVNARQKLGTSAALFSHFDCAASVFGKPAKFRRVVRRAGVNPQNVIAIGDEVRGRTIKVVNARGNNLKNVTAEIPLGLFTAVTGVSGGGKSTLLIDTLYKAIARKLNNASEGAAPHDRIEGLEHIDKIIDIDQSPIGRTPRSNPATYTGAFTPIREWFAGLPEAKARGYEPGRFSFNVKGGRCEACQGDGVIKIEMHFLPDVYVTCDVCKGKRYNRETLEVLFKGKSIADVLDMTVEEAAEFFKAVPRVRETFQTLHRVGLDYIHVGQQATTLSGGEAQRVKLAKELSKRATGRTLYILDEPTTGLHFHDVKKLLEVLHELVAQGNTVVVIEHNLEVIKTADWVIDLGPEGGDGGGEIVAWGPPEDIVKAPRSYTGKFLEPVLKKARKPKRRSTSEAAE